MDLTYLQRELESRPLDEGVRAVVPKVVRWLEGLSEDSAQFITVRRVVDRLDISPEQTDAVRATLFLLTQLPKGILSKGVYWEDENGRIRELEPELYAEALETGILAHPDHGTEHHDFMEWVQPFFWVEREVFHTFENGNGV